MKEPQWNFASSLSQRSTNIFPVESLLKFVKGTRVVLEVGYENEISIKKISFPPPYNLSSYGIVVLFRQLRVVLTLQVSHCDPLFRFRQPYESKRKNSPVQFPSLQNSSKSSPPTRGDLRVYQNPSPDHIGCIFIRSKKLYFFLEMITCVL